MTGPSAGISTASPKSAVVVDFIVVDAPGSGFVAIASVRGRLATVSFFFVMLSFGSDFATSIPTAVAEIDGLGVDWFLRSSLEGFRSPIGAGLESGRRDLRSALVTVLGDAAFFGEGADLGSVFDSGAAFLFCLGASESERVCVKIRSALGWAFSEGLVLGAEAALAISASFNGSSLSGSGKAIS